jgi:hypothetical protein
MSKNLERKLKTTYSGIINPNIINFERALSIKKPNRSIRSGIRSNSVTSGGKSRNMYKTK